MKNKYIQVYESLVPDDPVSEEDRRYEGIIEEMKAIEEDNSIMDAMEVIRWWACWDYGDKTEEQNLRSWVIKARKKMMKEN